MITDTMLTQVAKALNNEAYTTSAYLAVTTDTDYSADPTDTTIGTEIGSRAAVSATRAGVVQSYSAIRSGANVIGSPSDILTGVGLFSASTVGDLSITVPLPSLSHTTSFDIEFNFEVTVSRR